ncbi:MAG TPA: acyl-CoA dehydrogenase family protein [Myxococcota bacterium]|nr:acyl-CoA dehydrogenase family protein [Myxococcota bacterium]
MDLHDSPAEATFRAEARAFLSAHAHEGKLDYYEEEVSTPELLAAAKRWQRTLYESGWAALHWPERYGGRGLGPVELIIWNQELGRAGVGGVAVRARDRYGGAHPHRPWQRRAEAAVPPSHAPG